MHALLNSVQPFYIRAEILLSHRSMVSLQDRSSLYTQAICTAEDIKHL